GPTFLEMANTLTVSADAPETGPVDEPTTAAEIRQWASSAVASTEYDTDSWSAQQTTGEPDTFECGDITTAWASASSIEIATLDVYYDVPVFATEVNIYQTYNPNQVVKVEAMGVDGEMFTLYNGEAEIVDDPCPYVLNISGDGEQTSFAVIGLRITVDQETLAVGWNEIDAVELVGVPASGSADSGSTGAVSPAPVAGEGDLSVTFVQDDSEVAFSFFIDNPSTDMSVEDSTYEATLYDADGNVLETENGYVDLLLPGQQTLIADSVYLSDDAVVAQLAVTFTYGDETTVDIAPDFLAVANPAYYADEYFPIATGVLSSQLEQIITDVRVNAVAFDADGNVVGSGYSYTDFVPAGGSTGASIYMTVGGDVDHVELYPLVTSLSDLVDPADQGLTLTDLGFGQDDVELGYAFLLENNSDATLAYSIYQVTAYDVDGAVVESTSGYINTIFAGEAFGVGDSIYLPEDVVVDRVVVQVLDGSAQDHDELTENPFTATDGVFVADSFFPQVTGTLNNAYGKPATDVLVYTVLYDAAGNIIGGGFTYVDEVPAAGSVDFETSVSLEADAEVATVQMFATVSGLTEFSE
ncbi:MAG: hypothetical protein H6660_19150, partial [Ardenticatenaceae bacterium]|nr:hypothetical protein [Ardenticatenaceae bacterium]